MRSPVSAPLASTVWVRMARGPYAIFLSKPGHVQHGTLNWGCLAAGQLIASLGVFALEITLCPHLSELLHLLHLNMKFEFVHDLSRLPA